MTYLENYRPGRMTVTYNGRVVVLDPDSERVDFLNACDEVANMMEEMRDARLAATHPEPEPKRVVAFPIVARLRTARERDYAARRSFDFVFSGEPPPEGVVVLEHLRAPAERPID